MDKEDAIGYIDYRLKVAGAQRPIFDRKAELLICKASSGIPRMINGIADMALLMGYAKNVKKINEEMVKEVVLQLSVETSSSEK